MVFAMVVSCSKDDDNNNKNNGQENSSEETTDPNSSLWGVWKGSGVMIEGNRASMTLTLNSDGTGSFLASSSRKMMAKAIEKYSLSSDKNYLYITFKDDPVFILCDIEGWTNTKMQLTFTDGDDEICGTYNLTKTGGGDANNSNSSSSSSDEFISIKAVKVLGVESSSGDWSYSGSTVSMYKKKRADGKWVLYSSSQNIIGTASANSDRKRGSTNVSSYSYYVLTNVTLHSKTYYYFN